MTVYLLIREDQNQHGYVDSGVIGTFARIDTAKETLQAQARIERLAGRRVEGDAGCRDGEWEVSLRIEEHAIRD